MTLAISFVRLMGHAGLHGLNAPALQSAHWRIKAAMQDLNSLADRVMEHGRHGFPPFSFRDFATLECCPSRGLSVKPRPPMRQHAFLHFRLTVNLYPSVCNPPMEV